PFECESFPLAALKTGLDCALDQADCFTRLVWRHELACVIENLIKEVFTFKDLNDQSVLQRFLERNHAAGCREIQGASLSDESGQTLRAAHTRNDAEIDFRKPGASGILFRDTNVAG